MNNSELLTVLNKLRTARDGADWRGKFTAAMRDATKQHRYSAIAEPLDAAILALEKELDKRKRRAKYQRGSSRPYRTPYADN